MTLVPCRHPLGFLKYVLLVVLGGGTARAADLIPVEVGNVPSLTGAPLYIAAEKGYFTAAGLAVHLQNAGPPSESTMLLATDRLQFAGGSLSVGFFNSVERKLPITLVLSRAVSPFYHFLMVRTDLRDRIKQPRDLKGRVVAVDAVGSNLLHELSKVLDAGGLTLADIDLKYLSFRNMPEALISQSLDVGLMISPMQEAAEEQGIAVKWLNTDTVMKPQPVVTSVLEMNTDWAQAHEAAAREFVRATLRAARDYCDAYHQGPNRAEIVRILAAYSDVKDEALIDRIDWSAMDLGGRIFEPSVRDVQHFFFEQGSIAEETPYERLAPPAWVAEVAASLGPYTPARDDGKPGCR